MFNFQDIMNFEYRFGMGVYLLEEIILTNRFCNFSIL